MERTSPRKKLTPDGATIEVCQLFCRGLTRDRIVAHAKDEKWGLSGHALDGIIDRATERLVQTAAVLNHDAEVGKALTRLENLYQDAIDAKDTKTALAVQKEINSLLKLGEHARRAHVLPRAGAQPAAQPARPRLVISK